MLLEQPDGQIDQIVETDRIIGPQSRLKALIELFGKFVMPSVPLCRCASIGRFAQGRFRGSKRGHLSHMSEHFSGELSDHSFHVPLVVQAKIAGIAEPADLFSEHLHAKTVECRQGDGTGILFPDERLDPFAHL